MEFRICAAIGQRLRYVPLPELGQSREEVVRGPWLEIVGVVQDLHVGTLDPDVARALTYYPLTTGQLQSAALMVRIRGGDTDGFAPRIRRIAAALDPDLRIGSVENLGALLRPSQVTTIITVLVLVMGTVILLSAAGIHALMSLTITRQRKEIGIRTALGARPGRLLVGIFARASAQLGIGAFAGAALGAALLVSSGMSDGAAIAVGVVVAVMWTAGLIAAAGPARRGLSVQPMEALREE